MALLPFPMDHKPKHNQQPREREARKVKPQQSNLELQHLQKDEEQNKLRLPDITSCVLSALTHMVKHDWGDWGIGFFGGLGGDIAFSLC